MGKLLTDSSEQVSHKSIKQCNMVNNDINWFESKHIAGKSALSQQYATICQQHHQQRKWVLFINPDEASLEQLAKTHGIDIGKVLCVSGKVKQHSGDSGQQKAASINLNIEQIKSVLSRGNCSAVILSNALFTQTELNALHRCAKQGQTQCLLLKTTQQAKLQLH